MKEYGYAGRKNLSNGRHGRKEIDMEYVYAQIDSGKKVKAVADELGVSTSTLNRRHKEFQERMKAGGKE